ncbi:hypothetical protein C436_05521 [Haloarcula marismortui ATCC 33800]|nr:hypothetical protein C436_05521 [Haloarcula sinaiiensis ATCC 33800]
MEFCEVSAEDGEDAEVLIKCDAGHTKQAHKDEFTQYDIEFEAVLQAVSEVIEQKILTYDDTRLPRYTFAETESGLNIYLIVNPSEFQNTINEICVDALTDESAALLIAPDKKIKQLLEQKALFSSSNLIYSVPFSMLTEEEEIQSSLSAIRDIQNLEQSFMDDIVDDEGLVQRVNSNPRYILTELNHMRLLRLGKELPQSSGTRLEKIAESAFGHLFTTQADRGGEDDRGENLPDSVFYISDESLPNGYDSVLGVADAKSGKDAGFGNEPVDGKHEEYIKEARDQSVGGEKIAHTFVVLDFDGHQDIDFYDRMKEVYDDNEYMVVFTAEALAMTLSAYLSYTVSNDLSLVRGSFRTVIYPLFDPDKFNDDQLGLGELTREVGRDQPTYDNQYKQRSDLLIVTPEVIRQLFERFAESSKEIQRIFQNYYKPRATL